MYAHIDMNQSAGAPPRSIRPQDARAGAAVLLAALAGPAAGDECSDYRLALALEDAASQSVSTYVTEAKNAGVDFALALEDAASQSVYWNPPISRR